MSSFFPTPIPTIFWTTLLALIIILGIATLIGRLLVELFPYRLRGPARFYLSPVLGLAVLTLLASLIGRFLPLGESLIAPVLLAFLIIWALIREKKVYTALHHVALVSVFGILCGASLLGPLLVFGAFNAHNDTFTYLVHANWLQEHAFSEAITMQTVTPLTTQVFLYQHFGFRMGSSFLLALSQALLNLRWSYEAYPAVIITALAACCLSIGYPLNNSLRKTKRLIRLILLILPALSLGGLVFGANLGFLPQTVGLALGAGLLFTFGSTLNWLSKNVVSVKQIIKITTPSVLLFATAIFAYSELAPFIVIAIAGSGIFMMLCSNRRPNILCHLILLFILTGILLNTELFRLFEALLVQSGAVVGTPVDWSLLGYAAHAFGLHGGAWDILQWSTPELMGSKSFILGTLATGLVAVIILIGWRVISRATFTGEIMPVMIILVVFFITFFYFRFLVPSPFPVGVGQSWSQFKLANWAQPFLMVPVFLGVFSLRQHLGRYFEIVVLMIIILCLVSTTLFGLARIKPLIQYYGDTRDLNQFYKDFRLTVINNCPPTVPIYLALNGQHYKFRQMAVYYLADRIVNSDWTDDGMVFPWLPIENQRQVMNVGDFVIAPIGEDSWLKDETTIGKFRVGFFDGQGQVRITNVLGSHGRETDGNNWWHWVERKVAFNMEAFYIPEEYTQMKLNFEYATLGQQTLTVIINTTDGDVIDFSLYSQGVDSAIIEYVFNLPPSKISQISIESDGRAKWISKNDKRLATFIIRNLYVTPYHSTEME